VYGGKCKDEEQGQEPEVDVDVLRKALVSQMYFVWELLAVLALFAAGFAALAFVAEACTCCTAVGIGRGPGGRQPASVMWPHGRVSTRSKMRAQAVSASGSVDSALTI